MTNHFIPLIIMAILAILLGVGGLVISALIGPTKSKNKDKLSNYESGIEPSSNDWKDLKFKNNFFLVALSFIVFDVELVFLYPWAIQWETLGKETFIVIIIFIFLISLPFLYELKKKTFDIK